MSLQITSFKAVEDIEMLLSTYYIKSGKNLLNFKILKNKISTFYFSHHTNVEF